MKIRKEKAQDLSDIYEINRAAFGQSTEGDIVNALRANCTDILSMVADDGRQIVGHIFFSPAVIVSDQGLVTGTGLAPMAVHPDHQRQGVGSALVKAGVDMLIKNNTPFIIVLGHPEFYPRFGFEAASCFGIRCQWDVPDEAFMIRILDAGRMEGVRGVASYRSEFDAAM